MTEYTFEINQRVKVRVHGEATEENQEKALAEAVLKVKNNLDEDDFDCIAVNTDCGYETEYKEAV